MKALVWIEVPRTKRIETPHSDRYGTFTTFSSVTDRTERVLVSVEVDEKRLAAWMGTKARLSKGQKAVEACGDLVVRVERVETKT